jgi:hypothetical protein
MEVAGRKVADIAEVAVHRYLVVGRIDLVVAVDTEVEMLGHTVVG